MDQQIQWIIEGAPIEKLPGGKLFQEQYDKAGYKEKLEWVLKQPDDLIPEVTPENKVEKRKAKKLLEMIEEKF